MNIATTAPRVGARLPNLSLESVHGKTVRINDYRHRCNLIVAFTADVDSAASTRLLPRLVEHDSDFDFEDARILAIVHGTPAEAAQLQQQHNLPFPILVDEDGGAHRTAAAWTADHPAPSIYVLDRYGKIYAAYRASEETTLPTVDEIVEWLRFVNLQCPECGVTEWPIR